jgi:hypothetical protein
MLPQCKDLKMKSTLFVAIILSIRVASAESWAPVTSSIAKRDGINDAPCAVSRTISFYILSS